MTPTIDKEIVANLWVQTEVDDGHEARCVVEVDSTEPDEVHVNIQSAEDKSVDFYLTPERALRLGHALIEQGLSPAPCS